MFAFAGAVALDRLVADSPGWGRGLLALPLIAVVYVQLATLPSLGREYRFGLGAPDDFHVGRRIDAATEYLRGEMSADDKLLLWMEQRGYLFHGVDYLPYHIGSGSPTLAFVHRFADHRALQCALQEMGITHVLHNRRFAKIVQPGLFVAGYDQNDFVSDRGRVNRLLETGGQLLIAKDEFEVYRLEHRACEGH